MKKVLIVCCLLFITVFLFSEQVLKYRVTEGDKVNITSITLKYISNGYLYISKNENVEIRCTLDSAFSDLDWWQKLGYASRKYKIEKKKDWRQPSPSRNRCCPVFLHRSRQLM